MKLAIVLPEQPATSNAAIGDFKLNRSLGRKGRHVWKNRLFDTASESDMAEFSAVQPQIHEYWTLKDLPIMVLAVACPAPDLASTSPATTLAQAHAIQPLILTPEEQQEIITWTNTRRETVLAELAAQRAEAEAAAAAASAETGTEEKDEASDNPLPPPQPVTPPVTETTAPPAPPAPGIVDPLAGATFVEPPPAPEPTAPAATEGELEIDAPAPDAVPTEGEIDAPTPAPKPAAKKAAAKKK